MKTPLTSSQQVARHALRWLGFLVLLAVMVWLATLDCRAEPVYHITAEQRRSFTSYEETIGDTGSMYPKLDVGDIIRIEPVGAHPFGPQLIGCIVLRYIPWLTNNHTRKQTGAPKITGGCVIHEVIAASPRGLITCGINNGLRGAGACQDPGFMAEDDYCGFVVIVKKNPNPPPHKTNLWQKD